MGIPSTSPVEIGICVLVQKRMERETRNDHSVVMIWGDLMKALVLNRLVLSPTLLLYGLVPH